MNGRMTRFRIPGMMEDINIEELMSRVPAVKKTKPKPKTKAKAKPVAKAKTKNPRVKTKRRSPVGRRINMRGGPLGLEDLINDEQTIGQVPDSVRERFKPPAFDRSKLEEAFSKASKQKELQTKFPLPEGLRSGGEYYYDPITGDPMYRPPMPVGKPEVPRAQVRPPSINLITQRPQMMQLKPETEQSNTEGSFGPSLDRPPQSREEVLESIARIIGGSRSSGPIRSGFFKNAIYPGDPGYEEALAESKLSDSGGGGLFGGGRNLTPELIQRIKEAQEARRATGKGAGLFGLIGGGQRTTAPSFQNPFLGQMQMQQPINPIVGFQDESQPKFPDIPQFMQTAAGETFGGYGGLSSIKPIMQYAGMGDSPSAPPTMNKKRPLPRPPYNPDAQPGGPSMPKDILRRLFT